MNCFSSDNRPKMAPLILLSQESPYQLFKEYPITLAYLLPVLCSETCRWLPSSGIYSPFDSDCWVAIVIWHHWYLTIMSGPELVCSWKLIPTFKYMKLAPSFGLKPMGSSADSPLLVGLKAILVWWIKFSPFWHTSESWPLLIKHLPTAQKLAQIGTKMKSSCSDTNRRKCLSWVWCK